MRAIPTMIGYKCFLMNYLFLLILVGGLFWEKLLDICIWMRRSTHYSVIVTHKEMAGLENEETLRAEGK